MRIECQCGQSHQVTAAMAGREVACPCGRSLPVPSLRKLEQMRADVLLHEQFSDAEYWEKRGCFVCSSPAKVDAVAECVLTRPVYGTLPAPRFWMWTALFHPLVALLGTAATSGEVLVKRSERTELPLRYCAACSTHRDLTDHFIAQLQQLSLGRDFLEEFPELKCVVSINPRHP